MPVPVVENVLKLNDQMAALNRAHLRRLGVFTVDLLGAPGCGKTALIEATLQRLPPELRVGVIAGDLTTQRDADRMAKYTDHVVQINTGKGCHLEAHHVMQAMRTLHVETLNILIIENVGNLICPVGFDLGQDVKVGMFSTTGGDDKAAKHPYIVCESSLLVLNKTDLLPYVPFNLPQFRRDVRRLNPDVEMLELSSTTGDGLDEWINWLLVQRLKAAADPHQPTHYLSTAK